MLLVGLGCSGLGKLCSLLKAPQHPLVLHTSLHVVLILGGERVLHWRIDLCYVAVAVTVISLPGRNLKVEVSKREPKKNQLRHFFFFFQIILLSLEM